MIDDEQLDKYRLAATKLRVIRDADPANDVIGIVIAWDDEHVLIRRQNRRVRKLSKSYIFQPFSEPRPEMEQLLHAEYDRQDDYSSGSSHLRE
ncbi:hypothetical protein [Marinicrinis lubricantis]|uniref:Uncharacterized protein n=1 Tax=Marinicrinis lubricantis TaxID=2086470 RepID=A0ABW1INU5_9BACL